MVVLVTGATDGLGRSVAQELVARGDTVLVHGRDPARLAATVAALDGGDRVRGYLADFGELAQVRRLAAEVRAAEPRLDVLLSNAALGFGGDQRQLTRDGLESRFQVNFLAGWLLSRELLGLLRASAPSRIVFVASMGQQPLEFDDLQLERGYSGRRAYCQSKLAQIIDTRRLARELAGTGVTVNAVHPAALMPTKIVVDRWRPQSTLAEGVEATLRMVAGEELAGVSGRYFTGLVEARPDPQADDEQAQERLEAVARRLTA